jgi:hypothetical protein
MGVARPVSWQDNDVWTDIVTYELSGASAIDGYQDTYNECSEDVAGYGSITFNLDGAKTCSMLHFKAVVGGSFSNLEISRKIGASFLLLWTGIPNGSEQQVPIITNQTFSQIKVTSNWINNGSGFADLYEIWFDEAIVNPTITPPVSPASGSTLGGGTLTITGTGFVSGATIQFGTATPIVCTFGSSTSISCAIPAHAAGVVNITVTNPDTGTVTSNNAFTYIALAPKSTTPTPINNSTGQATNVSLGWVTGGGTSSYNVYRKVDGGSYGNAIYQGANTSLAQSGLTNNQKYIWRVDSVNSVGDITTGDEWNFTTIVAAPAKASSPDPSNTPETNVSITKTLSWVNGDRTTEFDMFIREKGGSWIQKMTNSSHIINSWDGTGYFEHNKDYEWRVDCKNEGGTTTGDTWEFLTVAIVIPQSGGQVNQFVGGGWW